MSEIKKNIETCRGEDVLAEVSAAPQDPHFGSLVNEALDPLKQQALHQAGYDGYSEVIEQHKPYTFASAIIQMKSNLLLLLRALWQFPFGSGTLSLSDMWQHYITRLSGNETYGIPSRLSSLTDLPSAPLLLADRKICEPNAIDGISLAQILMDTDARNALTEIYDTNKGWTMASNQLGLYPNLTKVRLGCKDAASGVALIASGSPIQIVEFPELETMYFNPFYLSNVVQLSLPKLKSINAWSTSGAQIFCGSPTITEISLPSLESIQVGNYLARFCYNNSELTTLLMPNCKSINCIWDGASINSNPKLSKVVLGTLTNFDTSSTQQVFGNCPALIDLEIGEGTAISLNFAFWNPTNALDASLDTLVTDEDCHNNLEQFSKNFRTYIALRLADNGSGKTLTLSAAVFSSIWDANGNPQVLQDGLDQLRADIHNIVKTTKHWDVNKAN